MHIPPPNNTNPFSQYQEPSPTQPQSTVIANAQETVNNDEIDPQSEDQDLSEDDFPPIPLEILQNLILFHGVHIPNPNSSPPSNEHSS